MPDEVQAGGGAVDTLGERGVSARGVGDLRDRLDQLEKRFQAHLGQDWGAQGYDYPHPSMRVVTVTFGTGSGILTGKGLAFKLESTQRGIYWLEDIPPPADFDPPLSVPVPNISQTGQFSSDTSRWVTQAKADTSEHATISAIGGADSTASLAVSNANGSASASLFIIGTDTPYFQLATAYLQLASMTADPTASGGLSDGSIWYRSDTGQLFYQSNGTTKQLGGGMKIVSGSGYQVYPAAADGVGPLNAAVGEWGNGTYTQVVASTAEDIYVVGYIADVPSTNSHWEMDIATGGAGSESVKSTVPINRYVATAVGSSANNMVPLPFPIAVASGTRIAVRQRWGDTTGQLDNVKLVYVEQADLIDA